VIAQCKLHDKTDEINGIPAQMPKCGANVKSADGITHELYEDGLKISHDDEAQFGRLSVVYRQNRLMTY